MIRHVTLALRGLLAAMLLTAALSPAALAAPGDLDTTFAAGGVFTAPFMTTFPGAEDSHTVAVDSLGRVYLSATQEAQLGGGPPRKVNVVRLTPQGALDTSYGTGGTATLPTTGDVRNVGIVIDKLDRAVILTANGLDSGTQRIGLTRLTTGGQPDVSFDGDGVAESALPNTSANPWPAGIALDGDGAILVVGTLMSCPASCTKVSGFVTRFGDAGAVDTTYGTGGWTPIADSGTQMAAIHALPGGGAVVAGYDDFVQWVVERLTAAGAPDTTFDGDGLARSGLGLAAQDITSAYGVTVDAQGRPVVVGQYTPNNAAASVAVARWTSAGAPDSSFGTGSPAVGVELLPAGAGARGVDVETQCADGKLLVLSYGPRPGNSPSPNQLTLARLTDTGGLDPAFAAAATTPGIATMTAGEYNGATDLLVTTAGAYATGFRRLNDNMVFTDYPYVMRFAANEGCAAGAPPAGGTPPVTTPVTTPVATPIVKRKPALKVLDLVVLPGSKACVSRRLFKIRLRVPRSASVTQADVKVNGKRVGVRKGKRLRSTVDLRSLPKGRFSVQIVLHLKGGTTLKATRRYHTCKPKHHKR